MILVIENETDTSEMIQEVLKRAGYQVIAAKCGKAALEQIANNNVKLILCDIALPDIDGFAILEQVKRKYSDVPLVFTTAKTELKNKIKAVQMGVDGYLCKPFSIKELLEVVKGFLNAET